MDVDATRDSVARNQAGAASIVDRDFGTTFTYTIGPSTTTTTTTTTTTSTSTSTFTSTLVIAGGAVVAGVRAPIATDRAWYRVAGGGIGVSRRSPQGGGCAS
jgi:hypothetical protein